MESVVLYLKESYNELLHKVTWPTWASLLDSTKLVVIATIIFAAVVFVLDLISKGVLTTIYNINL